MLQNKDIETLRMLFSSHNYVMTTAELTASKLYYADIKQLLDEGLIERVRRGYYHWTQDYGESEVVIINRLFPDAVLCMETALLENCKMSLIGPTRKLAEATTRCQFF